MPPVWHGLEAAHAQHMVGTRGAGVGRGGGVGGVGRGWGTCVYVTRALPAQE